MFSTEFYLWTKFTIHIQLFQASKTEYVFLGNSTSSFSFICTSAWGKKEQTAEYK